MIYNVLVVDDSNFFQHRLKAIINEHPELNVIGVATNGQEAIEMAEQLQPDVISMDYEMPMLDGVSAVKAILAKRKVPIIMFSSLTYEGARITLDALEAGAVDFISKNFAEVSHDSVSLKRKLHSTLLSFAKQHKQKLTTLVKPAAPTSEAARTVITDLPTRAKAAEPVVHKAPAEQGTRQQDNGRVCVPSGVRLLIIGASTGGPVAVHQVLEALPANFPLPVVVIQHMPPNFTRALAERLDRLCALNVKEAQTGDKLAVGTVLVAPGGWQLMFDARQTGTIKLLEGDDRMHYKPSLDIAFASAANNYHADVLGIVLTGMGADGCEGAKIMRQKGSHIWSQDQASCVVYGMPKAVAEAGLSEYVLTLDAMGAALNRRC